jgi:hypothetical protein
MRDLIFVVEVAAIVLALVALFSVMRTNRRIDKNIESLTKMFGELKEGEDDGNR